MFGAPCGDFGVGSQRRVDLAICMEFETNIAEGGFIPRRLDGLDLQEIWPSPSSRDIDDFA